MKVRTVKAVATVIRSVVMKTKLPQQLAVAIWKNMGSIRPFDTDTRFQYVDRHPRA
jgi:hypothetical protein